MPVFSKEHDVYSCIGSFMQSVRTDNTIGPKIKASNLIIRFIYEDPGATITINAKNPSDGYYFDVLFGENDLDPNVTMSMSADVAHQFWLGRVNLTAAITKGTIKAKGPIQEILKLLPAIKPAYTMYPEYLKQNGRAGLVE